MAHGDGERQAEEQVTPSAPTSGTPGWPPSPQPGWPPPPQPYWPPPPPSPPVQSAWGTPPQPPQPPQAPQGWPPQPPQAPQGWAPQAPQGWPPQPPQAPQGWPPGAPSWQPAAPSRPSHLPALFSVVAVALIAFSAGMVVNRLAAPAAEQRPQQGSLENFDVYEQALREVREHYVDRDSLTDEQLLYGSIRGMVESLGDYNHTTFMTPEEFAAFQNQLSGSVAGIGILIIEENGAFIVERVIRDSPAEKGGIKAGDRITAVNGASVVGIDFAALAEKVRGKAGTKVAVTVIHAGSTTPVEVTLTRAQVEMPLVDWGMIPGTTIADIALYEFSDGAADQVDRAIDQAEARGATAIVLDLRGNPGGYADEATAVLGEFLSKGVAYIEEDADGKRKEIMVDTDRGATSLPLVVLVDDYTASAAEVVAGCLKDANRGTIVGLNTVGTGTILLPFALKDGSVILLGVVNWLTPKGDLIFGVGVAPDNAVALPDGAWPLDPFYFDKMTAAQLQTSGDAQLQKAVELLDH